ncbi:unnamed protein product, partial [Polarella glacialis]
VMSPLTKVMSPHTVILRQSPVLGPQAWSPALGPQARSPLIAPQARPSIVHMTSPGQTILRSPVVLVQQSQQQSLKHALIKDEDFELPPPVVGLEEELAAQDEDSDLDADEHHLEQDSNMCRSPCGTHWVKVSKKEFNLDYPYGIWFE